MKFGRPVRSQPSKKKLRNTRTMQLQGLHEKKTDSSSTHSPVTLTLENIDHRLQKLEIIFKDRIIEYERLKIVDEIAEDLRF
tara:strand:+ start:90 stop:335 length:246 start_codon:yes stop_codon:yes gene_type:complete